MGKIVITEEAVPQITLTGEFFGTKAEELMARLRDMFKQYPEIVVDISGVEFFDSHVLGTLVSVSLSSKHDGKKMRIRINKANKNSYSYMLFDVTNLLSALDYIE